MKSVVYMLCGLPGSGKTTYAKKVELEKGAKRLTLDEELFNRFGKEFPPKRYDEYERVTKNELRDVLKKCVVAGCSDIVLDYGFWKRAARQEYKELIEGLGGEWRLLYFKTSLDTLKTRLHTRNVQNLNSNHRISEELLEKFSKEFEEPNGEGEEIKI